MQQATFYPWQQQQASKWLSERQRFAHAWLIYGQEGIGKLNFCMAAATALLCENPINGLACGKCLSCHWMSLGNHLDFRLVLPDALSERLGYFHDEKSDETKLSNDIRIEQIRNLENFNGLSTHRGGYRVVVLGPAENLNAASSNAILKVLEEPSNNTIFLVFTHAIQKLLPTVISRCRRLPLALPHHDQSVAWLREQGVEQPELYLAATAGAPMAAYAQSVSNTEPVAYWLGDFVADLATRQFPNIDRYVSLLEKIPNPEWLDSLQRFSSDLLYVNYHLELRFFPSLRDPIQILAQHTRVLRIAQLHEYLLAQQRISKHPLNAKLFIQSTLQKVALACS